MLKFAKHQIRLHVYEVFKRLTKLIQKVIARRPAVRDAIASGMAPEGEKNVLKSTVAEN